MGHYNDIKTLPIIHALLYTNILLSQSASIAFELNSTNVDKLSNFNLIKCKCNGNEILNESSDCVNSSDNYVDYVASFNPYVPYIIDINDLNSTIVSSVNYSDVCVEKGQISIAITNVFLSQQSETSDILLWHRDTGAWYRDYCVEHVQNLWRNGTSIEATVCMEQVVVNVPSCCPDQHIFTEDLECDPHPDAILSPALFMGMTQIDNALILPTLQNFSKCDMYSFTLYPAYNFTGILKYHEPEIILETQHSVLSGDYFCIALSQEDGALELSYMAYEWHRDSWTKCENETRSKTGSPNRCEVIMYWIDLPLLLISTLLLTLMIVLFGVIPELRKSMGSKMIFCHMLSLLVAFLALIALHIPQNANCKIYGPAVQLCFLCSFFWLNVMCFDMWTRLRLSHPNGQSERGAKRRFIAYSIYAWGVPVIITFITVLMDNLHLIIIETEGFILPGWGVKNCWFGDSSAALLYYFGPIACLMFANLIFFVWVFVKLVTANFISGRILRDNRTPPHRRVWIYLKIFFMMGVTWIFEYISWQEGTCEYWIVTDIINALRGVILFIILFGSRKTLTKVNEKLATLNATIHTRFTRSVNTIRRLSLVSNLSQTVETRIDSQRASEIINDAVNRQQNNRLKKEKCIELNKISSM